MRFAKIKLATLLSLSLTVSFNLKAQAESESKSPKLDLRMTNSMVSLVQGTKTASFLSVGGLEAQFLYYFTSRFAAGVDYHIDFDFANHNIIFSGFDVFGRWYWWGQGTKTRTEESWGVVENRSTVSWYLSLDLSQRAYHPSAKNSTPESIPASSGSLSMAGAIGADLRLNRKIDLNLEVGSTLSNFASDPTAVQYKVMYFDIGLAYLF